MNPPAILMHWSVPIGTVRGVSFRLSYLVLVFVAAIAVQCHISLSSGLLAGVIMTCSLIAFQAGQLAVARDRVFYRGPVLLWPGGSFLLTRPVYQSAELASSIALAGLLTTSLLTGTAAVLICAELPSFPTELLVPFAVPVGLLTAQSDPWVTALISMFYVNWSLLILNLIPIPPFAASAFTTGGFRGEIDGDLTEAVSLRVGFLLAGLVLVLSVVLNLVFLTAIFATVLLMLMHDHRRYVEAHVVREIQQQYEAYRRRNNEEDSFQFGSFGSEYPASFRSSHSDREEELSQPGVSSAMATPMPQRSSEEELDRILQKIHTSGKAALSPEELETLQRLSSRLRDRRR